MAGAVQRSSHAAPRHHHHHAPSLPFRSGGHAPAHAALFQLGSHASAAAPALRPHLHRAVNFWASPRLGPSLFGPERLVTNTLIATCIAVYIHQLADPSLVRSFAQINVLIAMRGEYYRFLTAAFLHAGPLHLATNMLSLHWTGPALEQLLGRPTFLFVYFVGALCGGLMHYQMGHQYSVAMGASSAIVGLLGAMVMHKVRNRRINPLTGDDFSWLGQLAALNLFAAMASSGIAHWAHLGGLLGGAAAMFLVGPRYRWGSRGLANEPLLRLPGVRIPES